MFKITIPIFPKLKSLVGSYKITKDKAIVSNNST